MGHNIQDIFNWQMWCSDAEILTFIKPCLPKRPAKNYPEGVRKLFLKPKPSLSVNDSDDSDDSSDESSSDSDEDL